jgi:hypothetical protein
VRVFFFTSSDTSPSGAVDAFQCHVGVSFWFAAALVDVEEQGQKGEGEQGQDVFGLFEIYGHGCLLVLKVPELVEVFSRVWLSCLLVLFSAEAVDLVFELYGLPDGCGGVLIWSKPS